MKIVYLNGEFKNENEAKVSIFDRGFVFGDGIYEVVPVIQGEIVDVEGFWERLDRSLHEVNLKNPLTKDEYLSVFKALLSKNNITEGGVYAQITRGVAPREFFFPQNVEPTITAWAYSCVVLDDPHAKTGIKVISTPDLRWSRRDVKSISLLAQCMAKNLVHEAGADEGFMVENGLVTEGCSSSAYIVKNGKIITKPLSNEILPGVRRKNLMQIAKELNLQVEQRAFSIEEAKNADEVFISAATKLVMPVVEVDGVKIADGKPGQIALKLRNAYKERMLNEAKQSKEKK